MKNVTGSPARTAAAVDWLLASDEPAVRALTRSTLLGLQGGEDVASGPMVRALLEVDDRPEGRPLHPYTKWTGAHWRLVSLVSLGMPPGDPRLEGPVERVLTWLTARNRLARVGTVAGLTRRCASWEGNALAVCCRLGLADDPRVQALADYLVKWQWPDGGWNCDKSPSASNSSFHETLAPIWGLHEYASATGDGAAVAAADRGAELLLSRRLFRARRDGQIVHKSWVTLHYPPYWHYDILHALVVLARMDKVADERAGDALDILETLRRPDGRWEPGGRWWRSPGPGRTRAVDTVDWGRSGPNEMITLNALVALKAARRLQLRPRDSAAPADCETRFSDVRR